MRVGFTVKWNKLCEPREFIYEPQNTYQEQEEGEKEEDIKKKNQKQLSKESSYFSI